ncbi:MAG: hypothetical protein K5839_07095, partial [Treponemataceae bacterium]|nr:hypothetical protein [Treponemataceae bacterium]
DNLYLTLDMKSDAANNYSIKEGFNIYYTSLSSSSSSGGLITDLAGNRFASTSVESIDINPPKFMLTVAPVGTKELMITFTKPLRTTEANLSAIAENLEIVDIDGNAVSDIEIDSSRSAKILKTTDYRTLALVYLTENVTLDHILNYYVSVKNSNAIVDVNGTSMVSNHRHVFSDFGVNVIEPIYALDNAKQLLSTEVYGTDGVWAMRDFDGSGNGRMYPDTDITIGTQAPVISGEDEISQAITMYLDVNPTAASVSDTFNNKVGTDWRIWLPTDIGVLSSVANTKAKSLSGSQDDDNSSLRTYVIPNASDSENYGWTSGSEVQFLYALGNGTTYGLDTDMDGSVDRPLYLLHLDNDNDISSLDLWSFTITGLQTQRGGVTILNNVINVNVKEETIIEVDMESAGSLTVQVMTLDGNVVDVLQRGSVSSGLHYYRWDGTNRGGNAVARGLYFIRVVGPDIDETRKVICVKE